MHSGIDERLCRIADNGSRMRTKTLFFIGLLSTAFAMAGGFAHLLEFPHKIQLTGQEYLTVQQIYRGWAWLGIVIYASLISNLWLTIRLRGDKNAFFWALTAVLSIVGAQILFWVFTFPVNQETKNWTILPPDWQQLRTRWEYSHVAGAILDITGLVALIVAALTSKAAPGDRRL
jgi:uncharacterized membrane protein HdeD (DUF308 family)